MIFDILSIIPLFYNFYDYNSKVKATCLVEMLTFFKFFTCNDIIERMKLRLKLYGKRLHYYTIFSLAFYFIFFCHLFACL